MDIKYYVCTLGGTSTKSLGKNIGTRGFIEIM